MGINNYIKSAIAGILLFAMFCCHTNTSNDAPAEHRPMLYAIEEQGLYGYADSVGNIIIEPAYKLAFSDSFNTIAFVVQNSDIIGINIQGDSLFRVFNYDNGPDYVKEGLFRIIDENNLFGYADTLGSVVITPQYKFAFPFANGKAQVTNSGKQDINGEYSKWNSDNWFYIQNPLLDIKE